MIWYLLSATSLFVLFVSAHLYNTSSKKPVPKFIRFFVKVVRTVFCWDCKCTGIDEAEDDTAEEQEGDKEAVNCKEEGNSKTEEICHNGVRNRTMNLMINCCYCRYTPKQREITWQEASKTLDIFFMVSIYVVKIVFTSSVMYITVKRPELERII